MDFRAMLESEFWGIISQGEGAKVDFKRDDLRPEQLARLIVAFANGRDGGHILLGVEDNGEISGITREDPQNWVMNTIHEYVHPRIFIRVLGSRLT